MRLFPPEAYTNRELAQAYAWLQTQPEHVQRLGQTKEALVSLFKRAMRNGEAPIAETAMSSEAFRNDLKSLANGLKTFDKPPQAQVPPPQQIQHIQRAPPAPAPTPQAQFHQQPPAPPPQAHFHQQPPPMQQQPQATQNFAQPPAAIPSLSELAFVSDFELDERSWKMIQAVMVEFNLGHEMEAIRMLISVGFEKISALFPCKIPE